jgi:rubrerythrin
MAVFTATEAIEMAMEIEKNGEVFYNHAAARVADERVQALFEELAVQEQGHYQAFEKMLGGAQIALELPAAEYDQYQTYVRATLDNALFAGPDKAAAMAKQAQDWETAVRAAIGFEKDTLLFFYDLRDMVRETERETVSAIIREEKKHLRRLARMLAK